MKRMNYKRKLFSYIMIWSIFLSSLLLYSPANIALSASGVPEISITSPDEGSVFDVPKVEFTGRVSDSSTTAAKLLVKVFEQQSNSEKSIDITNDGILSYKDNSDYREFSFSKDFSEGIHSLSFVVTDEDGSSNELTRTITVKQAESKKTTTLVANQTVKSKLQSTKLSMNLLSESGPRPYMVEMNLFKDLNDTSSFLPAEDMTEVPLDYKIQIVIRTEGELANYLPVISVSSIKGVIPASEITKVQKLESKKQFENNIQEYVFTVSPKFEPGTTYYVYLNPEVSNSFGNIVPRSITFTTMSTNTQYQYPTTPERGTDFIHGGYSNVTNACEYCHSTHTGNSPTLDGGDFGKNVDNLCMACHDGTNGTPMLSKYNADNLHFQHADGKLKDSESCSSCHNPHTSWTKANPNKLQSITVQDSNGSHFQTLSYEKSSTAIGSAENFSLCLKCHNGNNASNIEQYYKTDTFINQSGHNIEATDDSGSPLKGQLPCAECHETHGSKNTKMLREELGNIKLADADKFKTTSPTWNEADERQFCLKCHNNKTEIYGKTGSFNLNGLDNNPILGHQKDDKQGCSTCHGGTSKTFIEAAHAPKK
jgi:predicted CXXCH cytochrome family protein